MNPFTDPSTNPRLFSTGYPTMDKIMTGGWHCIPLQEGLQVQSLDMKLSQKLQVESNRSQPHIEFGCLFSGKLNGCMKGDNNREEYYTNEPGKSWLAFSTKKIQSYTEYPAESPVYAVSFIVYGNLLKNILSARGVLPRDLSEEASNGFFSMTTPLTFGVKETAGIITKTIQQPEPLQHLHLISKAYELLGQIFMSRENEDSGLEMQEKKSALLYARQLLDKNLTSPPDIKTLARKSGVCKTYLTTAFKESFGTTIFGYVRQQRLSRARELIAVHGLSASEAAWEVGYSSLSAFHRAFLATYGTTPASYRCRSKKPE